MTVVIMTDLEGVSGVSLDTQMDGEGYLYACDRLIADTNAAIAGCFDGGAERVFIVDGHGSGENMDASKIDPRAQKLSIPDWMERTRRGEVDLYMEVGAHAKPGTLNAFLDHVQSSVKWFEYTINGVSYGEIAQGAIFCGAFDVPFVMVSGDRAACDEAKGLLGDVVCAEVKYGVGRNRAQCLENDVAEEKIRTAAQHAMKLYGKAKPFKLPMPLDIELVHTRSDYCDETMVRHPEFERLDARKVRRVVEKIEYYGDILFW